MPRRDNLSVLSIRALFPDEISDKVFISKYFVAKLIEIGNFNISNGNENYTIIGQEISRKL
jgi:hypothetical protein